MKIKEERWNEFVEYFNEKIQSNIRCSEDDNFYYYDEYNDCFAVNKIDYSISLTGNSDRDIQYYIDKLNISNFMNTKE